MRPFRIISKHREILLSLSIYEKTHLKEQTVFQHFDNKCFSFCFATPFGHKSTGVARPRCAWESGDPHVPSTSEPARQLL